MAQKFLITEGHAKSVCEVLPGGETEQEREYRLLCKWWRETLVDQGALPPPHHRAVDPERQNAQRDAGDTDECVLYEQGFRDKAEAMRAYAHQAKNRQLEVEAA